MHKIMLLSAILAGACTVDPATDSTDQDVSIWDDCATGTAANALVYEPPDAYTRNGDTINNTCGCKQWQQDNHDHGQTYADSHNPDCRRDSIADFSLHVQQLGYRLGAEVTSWHDVVSPDVCQRSNLIVKIQAWNGSSYTDLDSQNIPAVWSFSQAKCLPLSYYSGPWSNAYGSLRVRARAQRGDLDDLLGFNGVTITSFVY
jgi:hypothetical protein